MLGPRDRSRLAEQDSQEGRNERPARRYGVAPSRVGELGHDRLKPVLQQQAGCLAHGMAAARRSRRPSPPRGRHDALSRQAQLGRRLFRRQPVHPAWRARPAGLAAYFDSSAKSNVLRPAFTSAVSVDRLLYFAGILGGGATGAPPLEPSAEGSSGGMSVGRIKTL